MSQRNFGLGFGNVMSGISSGYGMLDSLFGFSRRKQKKDNKEMMRYSAGLGESQAKRDYARSVDMFGRQSSFSNEMFDKEMGFNKEMLEKQQQYNSAEAQKQRLKDAGMSVGLMMGGGGPGASTSASTSAPSAPGQSPAPSGRPAPMSMSDKLYGALELEALKTSIEGSKLANDSKRVDLEKKKTKADISKVEADTKKTISETETIDISNLWQGEKVLSEIAVNRERANLDKLKNKEVEVGVLKTAAETIVPYIQRDLADFKMGREFEMNASLTKEMIEKVKSEALKNNWDIGEFTNWKTWTMLGVEVGKSVVNAVTGGMIGKGLSKKAAGAAKKVIPTK